MSLLNDDFVFSIAGRPPPKLQCGRVLQASEDVQNNVAKIVPGHHNRINQQNKLNFRMPGSQ